MLAGAHPSSLAGPLLGPKADGPGAGSQPGTGAEGAQQSFSSVSSYPGRSTNEFIKASQICTQGLHVPKWIELMLLSSKLPKEFISNHLHLCCGGTREPGVVKLEALPLVVMSGQRLKSPTAWSGGRRLRDPMPRCPEPLSPVE